MSRKKKQSSSAAGTYALCITAGLIVGMGLSPIMGNFVVMVLVGALAGTVAAYFLNRQAARKTHKHHH